MKKNYVTGIAFIAQALVLTGVCALALLGCPTDGGGSGGGTYTPPPNPDTEDFGPNAVIAKTFPVTNAAGLGNAIAEINSGGGNGSVGNIRAVSNTGNYVITILGNISISENIYFNDSFRGKVSFRGNGMITLTNPGQWNLLNIKPSQTVILRGPTLKTGSGGDNHYIVEVNDNGTFMMPGGTLDGNNQAGGVSIFDGGHFEMSGGTIKGAINYELGVHLAEGGVFIMNGGSIIDNTELGVYVAGTFTMSGGTISNNGESGVGNGVVVESGTFTLKDGSISDNTEHGVWIGEHGTFTMTGGTISNNGAPGVDVENGGTFTMTDGSISGSTYCGVHVENGTFNLNPPATIAGNIKDNDTPQVLVESGAIFKINGVQQSEGDHN